MANHKDRADDTRIMEARELEERKNKARRYIEMDYYDPFQEVARNKPEHVEYAFIRTSIYDVPDYNRLPDMERLGWTPVPASRHPEIAFQSHLGNPASKQGFIENKGTILCERDKELCELERKKTRERNWVIQHSLPGRENFMGVQGISMRAGQQQQRGYAYDTQQKAFGYEPAAPKVRDSGMFEQF